MTADCTKPHLLNLPRELRDLIYTEALTYRARIPANFSSDDRHFYSYHTDYGRGLLNTSYISQHDAASSLRLVCAQFRDEIDQLYGDKTPTAVLYLYSSDKLDGFNAAIWPVWTQVPMLYKGAFNLVVEIKLEMVERWTRDCVTCYRNFIALYIDGAPRRAMRGGAHGTKSDLVLIEQLRQVEINISNVDRQDKQAEAHLGNSMRYFHWADHKHSMFKSWNASKVKLNDFVVWPVPAPDTRSPEELQWS